MHTLPFFSLKLMKKCRRIKFNENTHRAILIPFRRLKSDIADKQRKVINQEYYHPHDVPLYQTPSLDNKNAPRIDPERIIAPISNIDNHFPEANMPYISPLGEKDNAQKIIRQEPEMFLPEEPTFLEFWGFYPFLIFSGSFFLSQEILVFMSAGSSTIVLAPFIVMGFLAFYQAASKPFFELAQFQKDQYWVGVTLFRKNLNKAISFNQEMIKTEKRAKRFDEYLKKLIRNKVSFFSHQRKKTQIKNTLESLSRIKEAEEKLKKSTVIKKDAAFKSKKLFALLDQDKSFKEDWERRLFEKLKKGEREPEVKVDVASQLEKSAENDEEKLAMESIRKTSIRNFDLALKGILSSLKVFSEENLKGVSFAKSLTEEQKKQFASEKKILEGKLRLIREQVGRFKSERVPESLKGKLEEVESELGRIGSSKMGKSNY